LPNYLQPCAGDERSGREADVSLKDAAMIDRSVEWNFFEGRRARILRMHDDWYIRLQDRSLELIEQLVAADGDELSLDELIAVENFIDEIGGFENARLAIRALREIEDVA
jgi:hypothetical protein